MKITLGPKGRNVVLDKKFGSPLITNDGVTIAKEIELDDIKLRSFIGNSIDYAITFYTIINISFNIFAKCRRKENVSDLLKEYDKAWAEHKKLEEREDSSTSYCDQYLFSYNNLGLNETISYCRENLA